MKNMLLYIFIGKMNNRFCLDTFQQLEDNETLQDHWSQIYYAKIL